MTIPRKPRQRANYTAAEISAAEPRLMGPHVAILRAAMTGVNYRAIGLQLNVPGGTVRSRLNRARTAIAAVLEQMAKENAA